MILFDWECSSCEAVSEAAVDRPAPATLLIECGSCGVECEHKRLPPLTAKYLADRSFSPLVKGGQFDTAGFKPAPAMPTIPGSDEVARRVSAVLGSIPRDAPIESAREALRAATEGGPTAADCMAFVKSREYVEAERAHVSVRRENAAKQARARLIRAGRNVDVRHNPLPGDPKLMS